MANCRRREQATTRQVKIKMKTCLKVRVKLQKGGESTLGKEQMMENIENEEYDSTGSNYRRNRKNNKANEQMLLQL